MIFPLSEMVVSEESVESGSVSSCRRDEDAAAAVTEALITGCDVKARESSPQMINADWRKETAAVATAAVATAAEEEMIAGLLGAGAGTGAAPTNANALVATAVAIAVAGAGSDVDSP